MLAARKQKLSCSHANDCHSERSEESQRVVRSEILHYAQDDVMCRTAFTLIELMVSLSIMLLLTAMTVSAVNFTQDADRIKNAANQVQSYLEGGRNRAIYAKQPQGVRFLIDPNDPNGQSVNAMVFIGSPEKYSRGTIAIYRPDNESPGASPPVNGDNVADRDMPILARSRNRGITSWYNLQQRGLLVEGSRFIINGNFYSVSLSQLREPRYAPASYPDLQSQNWTDTLVLSRIFQGSKSSCPTPSTCPERADLTGTTGLNYELELSPSVLSNQEPRLLPLGIVIDLNNSQLPSSWTSGGNLDVLFSPRGTLFGNIVADGYVHLLLTNISDYTQGINPNNTTNTEKIGTYRAVTLFTKTGRVSIHPIDDSGTDYFRYAETGEIESE